MAGAQISSGLRSILNANKKFAPKNRSRYSVVGSSHYFSSVPDFARANKLSPWNGIRTKKRSRQLTLLISMTIDELFRPCQSLLWNKHTGLCSWTVVRKEVWVVWYGLHTNNTINISSVTRKPVVCIVRAKETYCSLITQALQNPAVIFVKVSWRIVLSHTFNVKTICF